LEDKTAGLPKDDAFGMLGLFIWYTTNSETDREGSMRNYRVIRALLYILVVAKDSISGSTIIGINLGKVWKGKALLT
jgi:hypothetical protein